MSTLDLVAVPVEQAAQDDATRKIEAAEAAVAEAKLKASEVEVGSIEERDVAVRIVAHFQAEFKRLEAERVELVKPLKDYTTGLDAKYKRLKDPIKVFVEEVKAKVITFNDQVERERRAEQRRLDEVREAREAEIRKRRAADEAEAKAIQDAATKERVDAEELAAEDPELAELVDEAREAERQAKTEADVVASLPEPSIPMATLAPAAKVEGAASTSRWEPEIVDIGAVPAHLPDGEPLIEVRTGPLRRYMHEYRRANNGQLPEISGIEFKQVSGLNVPAAVSV